MISFQSKADHSGMYLFSYARLIFIAPVILTLTRDLDDRS